MKCLHFFFSPLKIIELRWYLAGKNNCRLSHINICMNGWRPLYQYKKHNSAYTVHQLFRRTGLIGKSPVGQMFTCCNRASALPTLTPEIQCVLVKYRNRENALQESSYLEETQ